MTTLVGRCHCGACTVGLPRSPEFVGMCNCTLCRRTGFRGVYFTSDELEIVGEFDGYVRSDLEEPFLRTMRCRQCGTPTHWEPLTQPPHERMGVNANLFDVAALQGVPVRVVDGASW